MANGHGFAMPCVIWLDDVERQRLTEIAERSGACTERVGGRLLGKALLLAMATDGIAPPEPKVELTRAGKPGKQRLVPRSRKQ